MLHVSKLGRGLARSANSAMGRGGFVRAMGSVAPEIEGMQEEMTTWRRDFHQHPELAFEEIRTAGIVEEKLRAFGNIRIDRVSTTGVIGVLGRDFYRESRETGRVASGYRCARHGGAERV